MNKLITSVTIIILLITCAGCTSEDTYTKKEWLHDLGNYSGICLKEDDYNTCLYNLIEWDVVKNNEYVEEELLDAEFMAYTSARLFDHLESDINYQIINAEYFNEINTFISLDVYDLNDNVFDGKKIIKRSEALIVLERVIDILNNRIYEEYVEYHYDGNENNYDYLKMSSDEVIDFDDVYIEELYPFSETSSIYDESIYERKSRINLHKVTDVDGYRISYSVNTNRIHFRVSKNSDDDLNLYFDGDIYNIRPIYNFEYQDKKIDNAFFKLKYETSEELGVSKGKYYRLYGDLNTIDKHNIFSSLKSLWKKNDELIDKSFTLMKIHVPIKEAPGVEVVLELKLNIYLSGKVELAISSNHEIGFEMKNGKMRIISDHNYDGDFIVGATSSANVGLKATIVAYNLELMDINTKFGIKGDMKSTLHLYDSDGILYSESDNISYDELNELIDEGDAIYVCGDLSLHWLLNVAFNSEGTVLYTIGLNKYIDILDEDDQVFNNLSHIENGMFVKKCSYLNNYSSKQDDTIIVNPDRITLNAYSIVVKDEAKELGIKILPNGYGKEDLLYSVENNEILKIDNHLIYGLKPGATKIRIYTKDNKYEVYLNVLVSDG